MRKGIFFWDCLGMGIGGEGRNERRSFRRKWEGIRGRLGGWRFFWIFGFFMKNF